MKLTLRQLLDAEACAPQVVLFRSLFGDAVDVTAEECVAVSDKFHWDFAANQFLTYAELAEYDRVRAPALAEYESFSAAAWAEYQCVRAAARDEPERVTAALNEYWRAEAPEWDKLQRVLAAAFGRLYSTDAQPI